MMAEEGGEATQEEREHEDGEDHSTEDILTLRWELEEKNRELEQLAQIGQSLLQGKQYAEELAERYRIEGEKEIEALHTKLESALLELQSAHQQIEQLTDKIQRKKSKPAKDRENVDAKALAVRCALLEEQLTEASGANKRILDELKEKENQLEASRVKQKEYAQLLEHTRVLETELLELRQKLQRTNQDNVSLQRENSKLQLERQESESSFEEKLQSAKKEIESIVSQTAPKRTIVDDLKAQLQQTIEELENKEKELLQSRWETKRMEEGMASLIRENQRLCDERDEYLAFLHESRATIASLRMENNERLASAANTDQKSREEDSILGELQKEMEAKLADKKDLVEAVIHSPATTRKGAATTTVAAATSLPDDQSTTKEPRTGVEAPTVAEFGLINCEEYFLMASTAVKIGMAVKHPHVSDKVFQINSRHMFRQAAQLDIPFHEWHFWIVDRFSEKLKEYQLELAKKGVVIGLKDDGGPATRPKGVSPTSVPSKTGSVAPTATAKQATNAKQATSQLQQPSNSNVKEEEEGGLTGLWKSIFK
eukprot:TRINITY_DN10785_c0_g1_i1.p1 TRINITY_DN10785_c0_g1~~TRINITY_DN10785_c0_g1_i1.p1  ORF type:complete len:543 (+),score=174.49 TRINITY_DN10785_c0_g1_i1:96-1724(+)